MSDIDYIPRGDWSRLNTVLKRLEGSDRIAPADVDQANRDAQRLGLRTRYRRDGAAYQLDYPGEAA